MPENPDLSRVTQDAIDRLRQIASELRETALLSREALATSARLLRNISRPSAIIGRSLPERWDS